MVESRRYRDYGSSLAITLDGYNVAIFTRSVASLDFVIWDEAYKNVLALEVDAPDPISGIFPMVVGVNRRNEALTATLMVSTRSDPSSSTHADRVRAAVNHLGSQFLGAVRTLYSLSKQQVEGVPSMLAALKTFLEMPEGVAIESRTTRDNA